jgi:hypothetical protein
MYLDITGLQMKFNEAIPVYGDTSYRNKKCPSEALEQVTFFNRIRKLYPDTYGLLAVHIKNEGKRTAHQAMKDKAEGMTTGASDIIIPGKPAFVCEMKRRDHTLSQWQDGQQEYILAAINTGAFACVALGADAAMEAFNKWISLQ